MYEKIKRGFVIKEMKHKQKLVKEMIVSNTKKLFLENGIRKTTLRGIAKEMGIAFGNIYYYFKSKSDICSVLWAEYTNAYLDIFKNELKSDELQRKNGLEKIRFYYAELLEYFKENPLYAELIAFLMVERPKSSRTPRDIRDLERQTKKRIQDTLIQIYEEGKADKSIREDVSNVWYEAWSFNISYVAVIIHLVRYKVITEDVYDYYIDTYLKRLANEGG